MASLNSGAGISVRRICCSVSQPVFLLSQSRPRVNAGILSDFHGRIVSGAGGKRPHTQKDTADEREFHANPAESSASHPVCIYQDGCSQRCVARFHGDALDFCAESPRIERRKLRGAPDLLLR